VCGIAGALFDKIPSVDYSVLISRMMSSIQHRGPDSSGYHVDESDRLVLVHRRLAIQDLSEAGHQPMFSREKRYAIVFNGEIYNFQCLSTELVKSGYEFSGHSDTEVLLAAILVWGLENALQRLTGMFAFALWDSQEKVLHLCRDRVGEKPLYYGWADSGFYFSSELKAIESVVPKHLLTIDQQVLAEYFKYGYINAPYSIYKHIYKLMPGTYITITKDNISNCANHSPFTEQTKFSPKAYWDLLTVANTGLSNQFSNEDEAIQATDDLLHKTVSMQKVADVDVGTFLSGGIDSSLISAIAQSESSKSIKTFTIGFEEKEYDESGYAEEIAQHLGTDHKTVYVNAKDALETVPEICRIYDEPFADASQIPTLLVSKIAREEVTVCLSGDGGDELFAGYNRYNWSESIWGKIGPIPLPVRKLLALLLQQPKPEFWDACYKLIATIRNVNSKSAHRLVGLKLQKLSEFIVHASIEDAYQYLLSYWNMSECLTDIGTEPFQTSYYSHHPNTDKFIEKALFWDQMNYLPGDNLAKVDRASMAVSLETRLPLLSHEMIELSWRIPQAMKVKNGDSKWLLKQILFKYVPSHLVDRPKMGFSVPIASWLRNELREWAGDLLTSEELKNNRVLNQEQIYKAWTEHISGSKDHALRLWAVLMFLSWNNK